MKIIVVTTQKEFDDLPEKFSQYTRIEIRASSRIVVKKARENSSVVARESSSVEAWENSSVVARENSSVVARGSSSVEAWENSSVMAWENSSVVARGQSLVRAFSAGIKLALHGFSILSIPVSLDIKFKFEKTCVIQKYEAAEIETVHIPAVEKEIQAVREKIATLQAELTRIEAAGK